MTDKTVSHAIERESISCSPIAGCAETSRAAGNHLIVDMGNSQYALYAHLKPYSVTTSSGGRLGSKSISSWVGGYLS